MKADCEVMNVYCTKVHVPTYYTSIMQGHEFKYLFEVSIVDVRVEALTRSSASEWEIPNGERSRYSYSSTIESSVGSSVHQFIRFITVEASGV